LSFSNNAENLLLNWVLTTGTVTRPTAWYVALFTSDPTDADTGTEVSGGSYARTAVTFSVTGNAATNTGGVEFPAATANWGTVSHIGVYDASTSGNLIFHSALTTAKAITDGDVFRIPTGDLDFTLD
jgi:hypothetical protein